MVLDILGYVFGIGFIVFGISALVICGSEVYKVISKGKKKGDYKKSRYFAGMAIICAIALIIMASVF
ncbi:hypothetical protein [Staphylococcus simulans]|uniref:hypothetical protein n=1 Tax=Staphylococcus simulans TaxID=1286 RepID=UPI000D1F792C|nr:hypothetical protein [Staphylococcus simulans]PTJ15020.1 hypothetical protein BU038_08925 [Staphylococcus simulans]